MRAGKPFGAPEGVVLKRYSHSEIGIPNGCLATLYTMESTADFKHNNFFFYKQT